MFSDVACRSRRLRLDALAGDAECQSNSPMHGSVSRALFGPRSYRNPSCFSVAITPPTRDVASTTSTRTPRCAEGTRSSGRTGRRRRRHFRVESHAQLCIMRPLPSSRRMSELKNVSCVRGERTLFTAIGFTLERATLLRVSGANGTGKRACFASSAVSCCPLTAKCTGRARTSARCAKITGETSSTWDT